MISSSQLIKNLCFIQSRIRSATHQSGRNEDEITLVAVTKTFSLEIWNKALEQNLSTIGENRIQETEIKSKRFKHRQKIELHLIGHLQNNKVRKAVKLFDIIQTIDSIKLLDRINRASKEENKNQKIFLQINTGEDPNKFGFTKQNAFTAAERSTELQNITLQGIMTIPPQNITEEKLVKIYEKTRKIRDNIQKKIERKCQYLSMGMSNDYEIAIRAGATHIRIGTALFGEKPK